MLIKTEHYTKEDGEKRKIEYYGKDEDHITAKVDSLDEPEPEPIEVPQVMSETDEAIMDTNAKVTYLECLAELNQ